MNKGLLVMLVVLVVSLLLVAGVTASEQAVVVGPPEDAIQIFENTSFEDGVDPWHLYGNAGRVLNG